MTLKELRMKAGLTQAECAKFLGISYRTYKRYETEESYQGTIKYNYMLEKLAKFCAIDEEHGILSVDIIKSTCEEVFKSYPVNFCYLFGSYAKGKAKETSDVDLLIDMENNGLHFFEIVELLRQKLCKKIDLLDLGQLRDNPTLLQEILKDGVRIYG